MKKLLLLFLFLFITFGVQAASVTRIASVASGNWTAAGTWKVVDATSELDSEAGNTLTTTSPVYSAGFVPGAITVDAICVKVSQVSNAPAGTLTVDLRDSSFSSNMVSVTINVADLPNHDMAAVLPYVGAAQVYEHQWLVLAFPAKTLGAGTNYTIGVSSSQAGMVGFYRNATAGNWARMLRTTTTGAPVTTDKLIIAGDRGVAGSVTNRTVIMNNTDTTTFGQIASATFCQSIVVCDGGTLAWDTSASVTNNLTVAGTFWIGEGGTVTMGTAAVPTPSTSVNRLSFDLTATGDSCLTNGPGGTFKTGGDPKEPWCYLNTGVAAGASTYTLLPRTVAAANLNWGAADFLVFAPSTRTRSDVDYRTNSSFSNITNGTLATTFSVAHPSTNTDILCPVGNLTRNVQIRGESASLNSVANFGSFSTNDIQFAEFMFIGTGSANKEGAVGCYVCGGSFTLNGCAINGSSAGYGVYIDAGQGYSGSPVVTSNTIYGPASSAVGVYFGRNSRPGDPAYLSGTRVSDNMVVATGSQTIGIFRVEANTNGGSFIFTNNDVSGSIGSGFKITGPLNSLVFRNNTAHSCSDVGMWFNCFTTSNSIMAGLKSARNRGGIYLSAGNWTIQDSTVFGNSNVGFAADGSQILILTNCSSFGETSYAQTNGFAGGFPSFSLSGGTSVAEASGFIGGWGGSLAQVKMIDCTFGTSGQAGSCANTNDLGNFQSRAEYQVQAYNTIMASANEVVLPSFANLSWVGSFKHDGVTASNKFWSLGGSGFSDTGIFNSASPSMRITPSSASVKFLMPDNYCVRVPVTSSATRNVKVYVRKSEVGDGAAYNGNQPRIIAKANYALGITTDTVIATAASTGWEQLSGTTPAVSADGTLLCYVDCDGTAGWINVDDWSFGVLNSLAMGYWIDGFPNVQADNSAGTAAVTAGFGFSQ